MSANLVAKACQDESTGAIAVEAIPLGVRIGHVAALDSEASPLVDFPGNPQPPIRAALALSVEDSQRLSRDWQQARVLIVFVNQDLRQPVITGIVCDSLPEACGPALTIPARLELHAVQEVVLQCGDARIVLRGDGKVVVGGREIESRAQQKHRIRGGTVSIN